MKKTYGVLLASLVLALTSGLTGPSAAETRSPRVPLTFGSFNIFSVQFDPLAAGEQHTWIERRPVVVDDILSNQIAVLGVQEAYNTPLNGAALASGTTQLEDLVNGLNAAGGTYAATTHHSRTTSIVYDRALVTPAASGLYRYLTQPTVTRDIRYMAWSIFTINSTGQQFFFATTHLMNDSPSGQQAEWTELIAQATLLSRGLPVIVTGDFQKSKRDEPAETMLRRMKRAGFGDVVGQKADVYAYEKLRARHTENAWINSMSHWIRNVREYSLPQHLVANNIDYIFASNNLPVLDWKVCARVGKGRKLTGIIPSDHFLVRAIVKI